MTSKYEILHWLATSDKAVGHALVVLYNRQTWDEQEREDTNHYNNRGFNKAHGKKGVSMAKWYLEKGFITPNMANYWRRPNAKGQMRIGIYWRQLQEAAAEKAAKKMKEAA